MSASRILPLCLLLAACGETHEPVSREYAFWHGPPPGGAPYDYFLTAYGGPSDPSAFGGVPACGGKRVNGAWYYATGAYTFGCGTKLELGAKGRCVVVKVVDNGPAPWVEGQARQLCGKTGYIIDASPLVSKHLYNTYSAGWSDCFPIKVTPVPAGTPTGPRSCGSGGASKFIGEPCGQNGDCLHDLCFSASSGYPGGMCTKSCSTVCPDMPGKPTTFCINSNGAGRCVSRCDWARHPGSGCRQGYTCVKLARNNQPWVRRNVCLPPGKYDGVEPHDAAGDLPNPEELSPGEWDDAGGCSVGAPNGGICVLLVLLVWLCVAGVRASSQR
jgi:hypothetical protein